MQKFTGIEYIKIDIANQYGKDKENWQNRIDWVDANMDHLAALTDQADKPLLYKKAVRALHDAQVGNPTGYIMGLDSTSSGPQLMAVLTGCYKTGISTNLTNTGNREELYGKIAIGMNKLVTETYTRNEVKQAAMTVLYGSRREPEMLFGEDTPELEAFYNMMYQEAPGPVELLGAIQSCWNPLGLEHKWTLPDGYVVHAKVMSQVDKTFKIDELDKTEVAYRTKLNQPQKKGLSLAASTIHSVDAYVVREMVRRLHKMNIQMAPIHDCFYARPQHMNKVRSTYIQILAEIADSNLMQDILRELLGDPGVTLQKKTNNLGSHIRNSDYALS